MKAILAAVSAGALVLAIATPASALSRGNPSNPDLRKEFYGDKPTKPLDGVPSAPMKRKAKKR